LLRRFAALLITIEVETKSYAVWREVECSRCEASRM
jgi:hypothetical protein